MRCACREENLQLKEGASGEDGAVAAALLAQGADAEGDLAPAEKGKQSRKVFMTPEEDELVLRTWVRWGASLLTVSAWRGCCEGASSSASICLSTAVAMQRPCPA
jgi:hypothetical protein